MIINKTNHTSVEPDGAQAESKSVKPDYEDELYWLEQRGIDRFMSRKLICGILKESGLQEALAAARADTDAQRKIATDLNRKLIEAQQEIARLTKENEELTEAGDLFLNQLQEAEKERDQLKERLQSCQHILEEKEADNSKLLAEKDQLKAKVEENKRSDIENARIYNEVFEQRDRLRDKVEQYEQERAELIQCLFDVMYQACGIEGSQYDIDNFCISAYEYASELLVKYDKIFEYNGRCAKIKKKLDAGKRDDDGK